MRLIVEGCVRCLTDWRDGAARVAAAVILAGIAAVSASAEARDAAHQVRTENVTATLVSEHRSAVPGSTVLVGLHQEIREGWHTYWQNPGDSGEQTRIDWQTPDGVTVGPILWPAPYRMPYNPLLNYGYKDEVLLASELHLPADWPVGEPIHLTAEATWLVCADICIPEEGSFSLELPTVADPPLADMSWASAFAATRAALPIDLPWAGQASIDGTAIHLTVAGGDWRAARLDDAYFFPDLWGVVEHAGPQTWLGDEAGLSLTMPLGLAPPVERLSGVLVLDETLDTGPVRRAFAVDIPIVQADGTGAAMANPGSAPRASVAGPFADAGGGQVLLLALGFALLGGVVLNLMPCVFPVLSMKTMALVQHAHADHRGRIRDAALYTAGILVTFGLVAATLLGLKSGGAQIGWGFQLQSPVFVVLLAYLLFAVGLSLSGLLHFGARLGNVGHSLAARPGGAGAFFTGMLATIVATPCTAPFMGAAVGFALTQPWVVSLLVFQALGLGLALPFVVLSLWPALLRRLPRPGPWMERLKQLLAFPMYLSAAWLLWVLGRQTGVDGIAAAMVGLVLIAFAAWLWGVARQSESHRGWRWAGVGLAAVALIGALGLTAPLSLAGHAASGSAGQTASDADVAWEPYSLDRLRQLRDQGRPVFVNMTASWCITCLVNEQVALSSSTVLGGMDAAGIVYLKGDWTNRDPAITALLESFGRSGVPFYVFYPAGSGSDPEPRILPQILTESIVLEALGLA